MVGKEKCEPIVLLSRTLKLSLLVKAIGKMKLAFRIDDQCFGGCIDCN